jgi:U3 small nucleolar RNA-associated protein 15
VLLKKVPTITYAMLDELVHRDALRIAISNRDETTLDPLLLFILHYIGYPQYQNCLIDVMNMVLDVYGGVMGKSVGMEQVVDKIGRRVREQVMIGEKMMGVVGLMEPLMK